jgi:hypothetical protein
MQIGLEQHIGNPAGMFFKIKIKEIEHKQH